MDASALRRIISGIESSLQVFQGSVERLSPAEMRTKNVLLAMKVQLVDDLQRVRRETYERLPKLRPHVPVEALKH